MIVFGWDSFKLASFKPSNVGLSVEMDTEITIERVQRYFHFLWIPSFPIGQVWVVKKKGDYDAHEPTLEMKQHLNNMQFKYRTPWYTYGLPIIISTIFALAFISSKITAYKLEQKHEIELKQKHEKLLSIVEKGAPSTYFTFENSASKKLYLKVIDSDATSLKCVLTNAKECNDNSNCAVEAFNTDQLEQEFRLDTINVSKKELINAYNAKEELNYYGTISLKGYEDMHMSEFHIINYPIFSFVDANYKEGNYRCIFKNIGAPITKITFKDGHYVNNNLTIDSASLAKQLDSGEEFVLTGKYSGEKPFLSGEILSVKPNNEIDTCRLDLNGIHASLKKEKR